MRAFPAVDGHRRPVGRRALRLQLLDPEPPPQCGTGDRAAGWHPHPAGRVLFLQCRRRRADGRQRLPGGLRHRPRRRRRTGHRPGRDRVLGRGRHLPGLDDALPGGLSRRPADRGAQLAPLLDPRLRPTRLADGAAGARRHGGRSIGTRLPVPQHDRWLVGNRGGGRWQRGAARDLRAATPVGRSRSPTR